MSSERTRRTKIQPEKPDTPQASSTGCFGHTGVYIRFRPKYQYRTKTEKTQVSNLKLSVTYLLDVLMSPPLSLERFCHVSQTRCPFFFFFFSPFRGSTPPLFLLSSFTQCPLFHIISYVSFSICLLQFPFVIKLFRFMCFNHNHTREIIPISNLLYK